MLIIYIICYYILKPEDKYFVIESEEIILRSEF